MSHWNHRVIEYVDPVTGEPWYMIHEVHYSNDGRPDAYSENGAPVSGTVAEMTETLEQMRRALKEPFLRERDFHAEGRNG